MSGSGYDPSTESMWRCVRSPILLKCSDPGRAWAGCLGTEEDGDLGEGAIQYAASIGSMTTGPGVCSGRGVLMTEKRGEFHGIHRASLQCRDDNVDCTQVRCGLYTRNDHTALENRVQDLYLPVAFDE